MLHDAQVDHMPYYSTFRVSEAAPTVLALQSFTPERCIMTCAFPVSAMAEWDAGDVASFMGVVVMVALADSAPEGEPDSPINHYPALLKPNTKQVLADASNVCPTARPEYLHISAVTGPDRLLIKRCMNGVIGKTVASLSLPRLALAGNAVAGAALIRAMVELHPDVFAPMDLVAWM